MADVRPQRSRIVLVTGGTGFTGAHLVTRLLAMGSLVRILARPPSNTLRNPSSVEIIRGDLRDQTTISRAVKGVDTVFHIAAAFRHARLSEKEYEAVNVTATGALVLASAEAGVRRFVHCSTVGVHGDVAGVANEDAPFRPGDWYQSTKLRGELLARELAEVQGLPLTVARPSGIYGPGDTRLLKLFRAVISRQFVMLGSGELHYHLTYIDDVIDGLVRCASTPRAVDRAYILAGPSPVTLNEIVATIADAAGVSRPSRRWPVEPVRRLARFCEHVCRPFGIEPPLHQRRIDFFTKNRAFAISRAGRELGRFGPKSRSKTASAVLSSGIDRRAGSDRPFTLAGRNQDVLTRDTGRYMVIRDMTPKRDDPVLETAEQRIGPELKRLRESAGLSLRTLADQAGFSASFISQVENGVASPSIASLEKMTSALGVTLADLFSIESSTEAAVVRADARPNFRSSWSKARVDALMPSQGSRTLQALMVTIEGGGSSGKKPAMSGVDQFAMAVDGRITLTHGDDEIELNRGDTVLIRAKTPHRWHNPGRQPAQVLIVSSRIA